MQTTREIKAQNFHQLLSWLDCDLDAATLKYEKVRVRLIKIFTCRNCPDPPALADETIDRVASKIEEVAATYEGDAELYFYGVARMICHETFRREKRKRQAQISFSSRNHSTQSSRGRCLDECLASLPAADEELFFDYYHSENTGIDYRRRLADRCGLELNALRVKIHRLKHSLQSCIRRCVEKNS